MDTIKAGDQVRIKNGVNIGKVFTVQDVSALDPRMLYIVVNGEEWVYTRKEVTKILGPDPAKIVVE